MRHTVCFRLAAGVTPSTAEELFETLRAIHGVREADRTFTPDLANVYDPADADLIPECYARLDDEIAVQAIMNLLREDDRVETAYVPASRKLIAPVGT
jgi:hypothetical protein